MDRHSTLSVITFFIIASGLTFAFSHLPSVMLSSVDIKDTLCGFGPLISGLICYKLFKTPTTYSINGAQPLKVWLIVLISATTFMVTNTRNSFGFNLLFVLSQIIYCFGEEFGWRHYLQSATNNTNKWLQSLIIGLVWFCWHFSWLQEPVKAMTGKNMNAPVPAVIVSAIIVLTILSFLLGMIMRKTHCVLLPTILHFAAKANMPTLIVTLTLVIIATETWKKFRLERKIAA